MLGGPPKILPAMDGCKPLMMMILLVARGPRPPKAATYPTLSPPPTDHPTTQNDTRTRPANPDQIQVKTTARPKKRRVKQ